MLFPCSLHCVNHGPCSGPQFPAISQCLLCYNLSCVYPANESLWAYAAFISYLSPSIKIFHETFHPSTSVCLIYSALSTSGKCSSFTKEKILYNYNFNYFLNVLAVKPAAVNGPYITHLLMHYSLLLNHAVREGYRVSIDVLISLFFPLKVTTRIFCNCSESKLTTARYKLFKATFQAYRGWVFDTQKKGV